MKLIKFLVVLIIVVTMVSSLWLHIKLVNYKRTVKELKEELNSNKEIHEKLKKSMLNAQAISMNHVGKKLSWLKLQKMYPEDDNRNDIPKKSKLILIFSEFGCNVCQDSETRFAVDIAEKYGEDVVLAIVHSDSKRYVRNYIRINQVNFPVYFCKDETFFNLNNVQNTSVIFVIDEEDQIIASHYPLPGQPEYSLPFHQFCHNFF